MLQPLDVSVNKPIKDHYRKAWTDWMLNAAKYTKCGNRAHPSYQERVDMMQKATTAVNETTGLLGNAFAACGIQCPIFSDVRDFERLNPSLQHVLHPSPTHISLNDFSLLQLAVIGEVSPSVYYFAVKYRLNDCELRALKMSPKCKDAIFAETKTEFLKALEIGQ